LLYLAKSNKIKLMNYNIAYFLYQLAQNHTWLLNFFQFCAAYGIFIIPVSLLLTFFGSSISSKKTAILAFLAVILGWLILATLTSHWLALPGPQLPPQAWQDPLFHKNEAATFPSQHAVALFALTFVYFFERMKGWSWILFCFSLVVVIARVAVALHTPLDIVAGLGLGFVAAALVWAIKSPLDFIIDPFVKLFVKWKI